MTDYLIHLAYGKDGHIKEKIVRIKAEDWKTTSDILDGISWCIEVDGKVIDVTPTILRLDREES